MLILITSEPRNIKQIYASIHKIPIHKSATVFLRILFLKCTITKVRLLRDVLLLISTWVVLGHIRGALYVALERLALDQPGSADLQTLDAAFSHHAAYVFNMVLKLFGSLFCGDELIQIRHVSLPLQYGARGHEYTLSC